MTPTAYIRRLFVNESGHGKRYVGFEQLWITEDGCEEWRPMVEREVYEKTAKWMQ